MKFCSFDWRQKSTPSLLKLMWWTTSGLSCFIFKIVGVMSLSVCQL